MEPAYRNDETEIDLRELLHLILSKIWLIVIAGIACALIAFLISRFVLVPTYESTTKIYILNKQEAGSTITSADLQTGSQLTQDYMQLIVSRPVSEQVIAELGLGMTPAQLASMIHVSNPANTRILDIVVQHTDPYEAKAIADAVRNAASAQIMKVMSTQQVNLVEEANIPTSASGPNTKLNLMIGGLLGILLAIAYILLRHFLDDTIKTPEDVEKYLGLSVLGIFPFEEGVEDDNKRHSRKKTRKPKSKTA